MANREGPSRSAALTARYRAARTRLMRPTAAEQPIVPAARPNVGRRSAGGRTRWLAGLIAFNEDLRRLFLRANTHTAILSGQRVRDVVAAQYGLTRIEMIGANSTRRVAWPRQVAMYICARHAGLPSRDIAALFGDRDRSTVRFAVRAVAARQGRSPALAAEIAALVAKCRLGDAA
jgi:hypothetical protein